MGAHLLAPGVAGVEGRFVARWSQSLPMPNQHKSWQHSSHVFVCKGCGNTFKTNNSINRHKKLVCGKPHHRKSFCNFSMWARTTIAEEIILNLKVRGEEERKRTVLASSKKNWKSIVAVLMKKKNCVMCIFKFFFCLLLIGLFARFVETNL